jgi:hypothetical protein
LFRRRFDDLRLYPILNYGICRRLEKEGGVFRFIGGLESVTDGHTLWIQGEDLTIPAALADAQTYLLPLKEGAQNIESFDLGEEAPEKIRWDRVSALAEGARVFVGGALAFRDKRWSFVSSRETPLLVIFFDGSDRSLTARAIRAGRHRNEYWNALTPYAMIIGAICQILIALSFLSRPAFRLTVITALIALFTPLLPLIPPGVLFTVLYRRLWWQARVFRAFRDLARLPQKYLAPGQESCTLPGGELYGPIRYKVLPPAVKEGKVPLLIPEQKTGEWYIFGALNSGHDMPSEPRDPFATFGALPGKPEDLARRYTFKAYTLEIISWLALLSGIGLNIFFIRMIFFLL